VSAQLQCPECGSGFPFAAKLVGRRVRCKACQHIFVVTAPADSPPAAGAAEELPVAIPVPDNTPTTPVPPAPAPMPPKSVARDTPEDPARTPYRMETPVKGFGGGTAKEDHWQGPKSDRYQRTARDDYEDEDRRPPAPRRGDTDRRPADEELDRPQARRKSEGDRGRDRDDHEEEDRRPQAPRRGDSHRGSADDHVDRPQTRRRGDSDRRRDRDEDEFDDDRTPRRRPAHFERSSGVGLLMVLTFAAVVVFLVVAAVVGFCLWP